MAWIEVDQDIVKAIWIDGYMPSSDFLEKTRLEYIDLDKRGDLIKRPYLTYSGDEMFKRLALVNRNYCEKRGRSLYDLFHHCDLFLTQFSSSSPRNDKKSISIFKPEFELGNSLVRELEEGNQDKNYRQLIVTFSPYVCSSGDDCTRQFIKKLNFKIREHKEYHSFDDFTKECKRLLEQYFIEPYIAPCIVAEERLKLLGFETKEPDI